VAVGSPGDVVERLRPGCRQSMAALRRGSTLCAFADDMVELPGVGAASLDLLAQAVEQSDVVQEEASALHMNASDARETTGDTDSVDLTATGTLDLMLACHRGTPPMSVAKKTPGSVLVWATARGSKRSGRFDPCSSVRHYKRSVPLIRRSVKAKWCGSGGVPQQFPASREPFTCVGTSRQGRLTSLHEKCILTSLPGDSGDYGCVRSQTMW
jgi:hypothetical protein